jgi:hypothetical protein
VNDRVTLRSTDGRSVLEWANPRRSRRNIFTCTATLDHEDETRGVELDMIGVYWGMWLEYAEDLAVNAAGWPGVKTWRSEHAEMVLRCSNDGEGTVRIAVGLGRLDHDDWREAAFDIRASELPRFRDELRLFLGESA